MTRHVSKVDTGRIYPRRREPTGAQRAECGAERRMCDKKLSNNLAQRLAKEG
jgi:hypothetical protein